VSQKLKDGTVICNFEVEVLVRPLAQAHLGPATGNAGTNGSHQRLPYPTSSQGRLFPAVVEIPHCIVADGKKRQGHCPASASKPSTRRLLP
jgi:hypothetical protein